MFGKKDIIWAGITVVTNAVNTTLVKAIESKKQKMLTDDYAELTRKYADVLAELEAYEGKDTETKEVKDEVIDVKVKEAK